MIVFLFYICAILFVLTFCAAVADAIGHFFPDWDPGRLEDEDE